MYSLARSRSLAIAIRGTISTMTVLGALAACSSEPTTVTSPTALNDRTSKHIACDPDNAELTLPPGFCALVYADLTMDGKAAAARHMAITPNGNVFVAINSPNNVNPSFGIVALRDRDGDGRADEQMQFSPGLGGSGIAWDNGTLYFGANDRVLRFQMGAGDLMPNGSPEIVVAGLPNTGDHISKTVVVGENHRLFVNLGSSSNSCQVQNRVAQSPGVFPCPDLPIRAGVWTFDARGTNQTEAMGQHYATGYRNLVALALNPRSGALYAVQHGRDMLFDNWPQFFTVDKDTIVPAEEFVRVGQGSNNGWPYCFFDAVLEKNKVLAPEYGGDGHIVKGGANNIDCSQFNQPFEAFGAHWAPNGLAFYTGKQFPEHYRDGAFVAFHGGFDRAPFPNEGFQVDFVPFDHSGNPAGHQEVFANGFAGSGAVLPATAKHRPVGVTVGPDGSLFVSDDRGGRIYRILYVGRGND